MAGFDGQFYSKIMIFYNPSFCLNKTEVLGGTGYVFRWPKKAPRSKIELPCRSGDVF